MTSTEEMHVVGYVGRRELEATLGNIYKNTNETAERKEGERERKNERYIYIYMEREENFPSHGFVYSVQTVYNEQTGE